MTDTRGEFEAECRRYWGDRCPDLEFKDGKYDGGRPALAWAFWQAATALERERCAMVCESEAEIQKASAKFCKVVNLDTRDFIICALSIRQGGDE